MRNSRQTAMRRSLAEKVIRPSPRSAGVKGVFPRYVSRTNAKKVGWRVDAGVYVPGLDRGMVMLDFDEYGILVGVEVLR